ncbi:putative alkaline shock family protein YloU [Kitasatospora sp. GAS204A]|uniref:hypothetical protein n=1 Tax=unclassified Kitasatospora TaxID=2633591 RepID=UPI0024762CBD|nr:hypothetical protein [Kitasatospora sp. GAS204B]MDH6117407.1 putative alkaline shock family protein YloU [Kitasatospora sp. GAS204B]
MRGGGAARGFAAEPGWGRDTGRGTPPAQRGRLGIADRVLVRIAELAARDALGPDRVGELPRVEVAVTQGVAQVRVGVELPFPADLGRWAAAVRAAVAERVGGLTGIPVREVLVVVERLHPVGLGDEAPSDGAADE